ncbi:MAG: primosomal protein N' [Methylophaga sp.]|nr:primosomal protein N' [Methylophaga sp.]
MISILQISIPCPLRFNFDYLSDQSLTHWQAGLRVRVSFGSRELIGIVISCKEIDDTVDTSKLKPILECLDQQPIIPADLLSLTHWLSDYYHHPLGDCFQTVLPKKIRHGEALDLQMETVWKSSQKQLKIKIGKKQQQILDLLTENNDGVVQSELYLQLGQCRSSLISLEEKQLIEQFQQIKKPSITHSMSTPCQLNQEQQLAVNTVWDSYENFTPYLLQGITGSGKTEVYIELAEKAVKEGKQVLILIPEIGLTTQFVTRFRQRLAVNIVVLNSSISDGERKQSWLLAKEGLADVIIGTRSAVFTPLKDIGLIIIDEEHDASYKQQDGLRYHARNVALIRAKRAHIPIVLGSATPSLESLYHVEQKRFQRLELNKRATGATLPKIHLIDSAGPKADNGVSSILYKAIQKQLDADNQVLLFINRRGFAPVLMCHECNWQATCSHCDAKMIVHQGRNTLCCHHCGLIQRLPSQCPQCQAPNLNTYGAGTEQIELSLQRYFPDTPVLRIDRDSTQRVNAFADIVADIRKGGAKILVGTQMLAKGHDFHDVTLVGVLDADQGLLSADFRATENLAQLIIQVTGRSGRGEKPGEVFIQTSQPQHEFWRDLIKQGYNYSANKLLEERKLIAMPPAAYLTIIRAEDKQEQLAMQFLTDVHALLTQHQQEVIVMGPVPAIMEKRAGRFRAQLLLTCSQRKPIHQLLDHSINAISSLKLSRKVRWSIDIDPLDLM